MRIHLDAIDTFKVISVPYQTYIGNNYIDDMPRNQDSGKFVLSHFQSLDIRYTSSVYLVIVLLLAFVHLYDTGILSDIFLSNMPLC